MIINKKNGVSYCRRRRRDGKGLAYREEGIHNIPFIREKTRQINKNKKDR